MAESIIMNKYSIARQIEKVHSSLDMALTTIYGQEEKTCIKILDHVYNYRFCIVKTDYRSNLYNVLKRMDRDINLLIMKSTELYDVSIVYNIKYDQYIRSLIKEIEMERFL